MPLSPTAKKLDALGYCILSGLSGRLVRRFKEGVSPLIDKPFAQRPNKFKFIGLYPKLFTEILEWGEIPELIATFCGDHARLDNHFGFSYPAKNATPNIHGGPFSEHRAVYYHSQAGIVQTSNLKIGVPLMSQRALALIPGSHKSPVPVNGMTATREELIHPRLLPGQVIVFFDALVHGTEETTADRCMLYYTITPGHVAWAEYEEPRWKKQLPETRRRFIRPPGIVQISPDNHQTRSVTVKLPTYPTKK